MLMSAPNGGKVEGNFTAQELDSIMKNHENKFMKVLDITTLSWVGPAIFDRPFWQYEPFEIDRFYIFIIGQG